MFPFKAFVSSRVLRPQRNDPEFQADSREAKRSLQRRRTCFALTLTLILLSATILALPAHAETPVTSPVADLSARPGSPTGFITLTHSASLEVQPGNSQACGSTQSGYTSQNSFWRVFDLNGQFGLTSPLTLQGVTFGVENTDGIFDVAVRAYTLSGTFTSENLTLVAQSDIQLDHASNGMLVSVPFDDDVISQSKDLVIEIHVPSGQAQPAQFYPASNDLGQSGPSYLSAPACGFLQPTDLATIGYPDMHLVMVVSGDAEAPTAISLTEFRGGQRLATVPAAVSLTATVASLWVWRRRNR